MTRRMRERAIPVRSEIAPRSWPWPCGQREVSARGPSLPVSQVPLSDPSVQSAPIGVRVMQEFNQAYRPQYFGGVEEHVGRMNPFGYQWTVHPRRCGCPSASIASLLDFCIFALGLAHPLGFEFLYASVQPDEDAPGG